MSVLAKRLREARLRLGVSQEKLGVLAGIDEASASARMNQYERGKYSPDWLTAQRLAQVLNVPVPYLYAEDEDVARLLLVFNDLAETDREQVLKLAELLLNGTPLGS